MTRRSRSVKKHDRWVLEVVLELRRTGDLEVWDALINTLRVFRSVAHQPHTTEGGTV